MLREDEVAVGDALECLLAIGAGSDAGRESLLQKNVLTTVVHRLNMASPSTISSSFDCCTLLFYGRPANLILASL